MCGSFNALNTRCRSTSLLLYCSSFIRHSSSAKKFGSSPGGSFFFSRQRCSSSSHFGTFMEVVKAVSRQGSEANNSVAIRVNKESYTYKHLISSALKICSQLSCTDAKSNHESSKRSEISSLSVDGVKGHGHLGGARIGIVAKPSAEFVAGILGAWFSGGVAVPLALGYPEAELLHVLTDSGVSMVLGTEDHLEYIRNVASKSAAGVFLIPRVPSVSSKMSVDSQDADVDEHRNLDASFENINNIEENFPALIVYTSGTTGKPKGAVHTHKSITAQVQMLAEAWEYTAADHFLHCLPLHHVHGLFNALLGPLYVGSTVEFLPKFSVSGIWQRWRESYPINGDRLNDAISVFTGVPTMYTRLIQGYEAMDPELQAASAYAARQLRLMMCGSSALPAPIMQRWEAITQHRLLERYGMTEFIMAISNPLKGVRKAGTVGKPFPRVEAKILAEDESGSNSTAVGELCIRSPSLFKEYWNLPEVTKESFTDGGFFKTGDTVTVDEDGYYIILGRTNADIMKVGGYKLSALEIESVILEHPDVAECAVLGIPDKDYGEAVSAIIVPREDLKNRQKEESKPALSLEELKTWAKDRLAPYKLPTRLFLWDSLPRNAMGKVNKKELKNLLATQQ